MPRPAPGPSPVAPAPRPAPKPQPPIAETAPVHDPEETAPEAAAPRTRERVSVEERETERGLRGLVGSGSSQVSVRAAMRARDASRPTDEDMAEAQERLLIVRRNWVPREELPARGGPAR
ncbi:hypothetical protein ACIA8K_11440 [Catenuloplanes sp. NPDC051500]|uniref:hypothetical protein n=1 Tax=Catenuloplanes sp. NPDC051500 TaxID=3363959 RepID=UPI0037BC0052